MCCGSRMLSSRVASSKAISADTWPKDRETIFPLQAAAGYAMLRGLFQHKKNVLVEGMSDYYYLHALNQQCRAKGLTALPDDIYITPCGGTKLVGHLAALFLGQDVRPLILLDSDEAGRVRRDALLKERYLGQDSHIVMKGIDLPDGWKTTVALQLVSSWAQQGSVLPDAVLKKAEKLFAVLQQRFTASAPDQIPAWLR